MDLSFTLRHRRGSRKPVLSNLLGECAARQAATPTARVQARLEPSTDDTVDPRVSLFADGKPTAGDACFGEIVKGRQPC